MTTFAERAAEVQDARKPSPEHPQGWEPGIAWDGRGGTITSRPLAEPTPDWDALLRIWGFDPDVVEVVEPVQVRTWDAAIGDGAVRTMWYYRAGLRRRRMGAASIEELVALVKRTKPKAPTTAPDGATFTVAFNDWQVGKASSERTVERIVAGIDATVTRFRAIQKRRPIGQVCIALLGDLGESCTGFYPMQEFNLDLDGREQARVARRLLLYGIDAFRPLVERVIVPAVPGNHGEKRKDGKAFTTFGDNVDLEVPEGVAEACAMNPAAYGHVSFVIPQDKLTLTLELSGTIVGFAHGHQAKRGGTTAQQKVATWWSGQAFGQRPVGDATILLSGHNHHNSLVEYGPRTHIQAGTMDGGSQWWDETVGSGSRPGMLSLVIDRDGWHDVDVAR